jgi:hypothetical protein
MNSNGILHATVNSKGHVVLWPSPGDAVSGKKKDEVVIQLSLTSHQIALVLRAEALAREKAKEV